MLKIPINNEYYSEKNRILERIEQHFHLSFAKRPSGNSFVPLQYNVAPFRLQYQISKEIAPLCESKGNPGVKAIRGQYDDSLNDARNDCE